MFEIIDSSYTRSKYEEIGLRLTDFQKATLIWNKPNTTRQERLCALRDLAEKTTDSVLKSQINERIAYEEKAMKAFAANRVGEPLYVVLDGTYHCACGYFGKYHTALSYAQDYIKQEKTTCVIEKHQIVNGDAIPLVRTSIRVNPNILTKKQEELVAYGGEASARLTLDKNAEVIELWSNELDENEDRKVDPFFQKRFECHFLALPYVHREGLSVKYLPTGEYGIVATTKDEWNRFLDKVRKGLCVDFFDTALTVYFLTEKGYWSHQHCNPIYLEVETPEKNIDDEKRYSFYRAIQAMSCYISGHKSAKQEELVLQTSREYADISERQAASEKSIKNAKHVEVC